MRNQANHATGRLIRSAYRTLDRNVPTLRTTQCPPLPRLVCGEPDWSVAERTHIAGCAYCQRILDVAARDRVALGARGLEATLPQVPTQTTLAAADYAMPTCAVQSQDERVCVEWFPRGDTFTLQLRTRDDRLLGQMFRYLLVQGDEPILRGLLQLDLDEGGWASAHTNFAVARFSGWIDTVQIEIAPVRGCLLVPADLDALAAPFTDGTVTPAWREWVRSAHTDTPAPRTAVAEALAELLERDA